MVGRVTVVHKHRHSLHTSKRLQRVATLFLSLFLTCSSEYLIPVHNHAVFACMPQSRSADMLVCTLYERDELVTGVEHDIVGRPA